MANKVITTNASAVVSTTSPKYGSGSLRVPAKAGTNGLTVPASADFNFPTGTDFTIEFFFKLDDVTVDSPVLYDINGSSGKGLMIAFRNGTNPGTPQKFEIYDYTNDDFVSLAAWNTLANATWYHFALVRSGTTVTCYIDGSSVGTVTNADKGNAANTLYIGNANGSGGFGIAGNMDEIRITKGTAIYTGNFTAPAAELQGGGNTVLLLHCNGANNSTAFYDYSDGNYYPDPDPEATSVDGAAGYFVGVDDSWAGIEAANGNTSGDSAASGIFVGGNGAWRGNMRSAFYFDISGIPDANNVTAATLSIYVTDVSMTFTPGSGAFSAQIYQGNLASSIAVANSDYQLMNDNTTAFSTSILFSSLTEAAYNDWAMNSAGLTYVGGRVAAGDIARFTCTDSVYDIGTSSPSSGASGGEHRAFCYFSDQAGTSTDPKLVVTHGVAVETSNLNTLTLLGIGNL